MAIFECNLFSKSLYSSVQVNVILPTPDSGDDFFAKKTYYPEAGQKYQKKDRMNPCMHSWCIL